MLHVKLPEYAKPGSVVHVQHQRTGQVFAATVPRGTAGGDTLQVAVPRQESEPAKTVSTASVPARPAVPPAPGAAPAPRKKRMPPGVKVERKGNQKKKKKKTGRSGVPFRDTEIAVVAVPMPVTIAALNKSSLLLFPGLANCAHTPPLIVVPRSDKSNTCVMAKCYTYRLIGFNLMRYEN